ncbi:CD225/dispanin family protein [Cellulomonas humilata]|uniref:CD225/dispanin family protein n=1 Tax=Cellulomonas humilata TaxID=144055 RepID=A0A7Y6A358_9CELL|nr:CD225/dispanin family protein [Cellulomonas humilata]NUU17822.1 CD225/dispanin family protein [Cellulomonas humilata]
MTTESSPSATPDPSAGGPATRPLPTPPPPPAPGPPLVTTPARPEPTAPVGWVIAAMILFWPTGIPALLASHRAARAYGAADTELAQRESANARRWGIISVCVGAALIAASVLLSILWAVVAAVAIRDAVDDGGWHRGPDWTFEMPDDPMGPGLPDRRGSDQ